MVKTFLVHASPPKSPPQALLSRYGSPFKRLAEGSKRMAERVAGDNRRTHTVMKITKGTKKLPMKVGKVGRRPNTETGHTKWHFRRVTDDAVDEILNLNIKALGRLRHKQRPRVCTLAKLRLISSRVKQPVERLRHVLRTVLEPRRKVSKKKMGKKKTVGTKKKKKMVKIEVPSSPKKKKKMVKIDVPSSPKRRTGVVQPMTPPRARTMKSEHLSPPRPVVKSDVKAETKAKLEQKKEKLEPKKESWSPRKPKIETKKEA